MRIEHLTPEQIEKLNQYKKEWTQYGLSTEPADRPRAEAAIALIYQTAGFEVPTIVWTESPFSQILLVSILQHFQEDKDSFEKLITLLQIEHNALMYRGDGVQVYDQVWRQVYDQVSDQVHEQVRDQVRDQVYDQVSNQVSNQVRDQVWEQVREQVREQVWRQVRDQVWEQVCEQVREQVWAQVHVQVWRQVERQVHDHVRSQVSVQVNDQVHEQVLTQVWAQVWDQVSSQVWDQVREQVWRQVGRQVHAQVSNQVWRQVGRQVHDQVRVQVYEQVWAQVRNQVTDQVSEQVREQVWAQVHDQVRIQVSGRVSGRVHDQVWRQVGRQVHAQVSNQVCTQVWLQINDLIKEILTTDKLKSKAKSNISKSIFGQHDAGWLSFYRVFHDFGLQEDMQKLTGLWELAKSAGWAQPFRTVCFVSERHNILKMDDAKRLHCEDGPACAFPDGFSVYAWHGTRIPSKWITDRASLTPTIALTWENIEQRRCACEILGWDAILSQLNVCTIDEDDDPEIGTLLEVELPDIGTERFLRVRCGTGRQFALPVPPTVQSAIEAQAWTWGLEPATFIKPEVRT